MKILFLWGSKHGQFVDVAKCVEFINVPVHEPRQVSYFDIPLSVYEPAYKIETYRLELISVGRDRVYRVYVLNTCTLSDSDCYDVVARYEKERQRE